MDMRVRRGLGLLVGAFAAWIALVIVGYVLNAVDMGALTEAVTNLVLLVAFLSAFAAAFVGLVLIAWGLLSPTRTSRQDSGRTG